MSDIFEEAKLEANSERKFTLFYKALPYILAFGVICAISIAIYYWQANKTLAENQKVSDLLVSAINSAAGESNDENGSAQAINSIISLGARQSELAELKIASILIQQQKIDAAKEKLTAIIAKDEYRLLTRKYAKLLWISLIIDQQAITEQEQQKLVAYFASFTPELPYYGMASILEGLYFYHIGQFDKAEAKANTILLDSRISPLIKEQARMLLLNIGTKQKASN